MDTTSNSQLSTIHERLLEGKLAWMAGFFY